MYFTNLRNIIQQKFISELKIKKNLMNPFISNTLSQCFGKSV